MGVGVKRRSGIYKGFIAIFFYSKYNCPVLGTVLNDSHSVSQKSFYLSVGTGSKWVDSHTTTAQCTLRDCIYCPLLSCQLHAVYYLCTSYWHMDIRSSKNCIVSNSLPNYFLMWLIGKLLHLFSSLNTSLNTVSTPWLTGWSRPFPLPDQGQFKVLLIRAGGHWAIMFANRTWWKFTFDSLFQILYLIERYSSSPPRPHFCSSSTAVTWPLLQGAIPRFSPSIPKPLSEQTMALSPSSPQSRLPPLFSEAPLLLVLLSSNQECTRCFHICCAI